MAQVPTVDAPRVLPSGAPLGISAPAEAFGAGVLGEGLKGVGQATGQVADVLSHHAIAVQEINNNATADEAGAAAIPAMNRIFSDYHTNVNGPAASAQYDNYAQKIEAARASFAEGMNPQAAQLYHQQTRRVMAGLFASMRAHADTEQAQFVKNSTIANTLTEWGAFAANPTHENLNHAVMANMDNFGKLAVYDYGAERTPEGKWVVRGNDGTVTDLSGQQAAAVSQNFVHTLEGMAGASPIQAYELAQRHSDLLFGADKAEVGKLRRLADPEYAAIDARDITSPLASGAISPRAATGEYANLAPAEVISNLRADPEGFIQSVTGIKPHLTSGMRTPGQNAAAGGSPTSEHLSNQAWDFTPPPGVTMTQLANAIQASGIPYDQLEVTPTHVHVGLRQGNLRREVIGPLAGQVQGANPPGTMPNSVQMNGNRDWALEQAHQRAVARYPDDPGLQAQYEMRLRGAVESQFNQVVQAQRGNEAETTAGVISQIEATGAEDISQLPPQSRAAIDSLPHNQQLQVQASLDRNANEWNPDREHNYQVMRGMAATDPVRFANTDWGTYDLRRTDRLWASVKQAKIAKGQDSGSRSYTDFTRALKSPRIADGLKATGIRPGTNSYLAFSGALLGEVEGWEAAHPGKTPSMDDYGNMAQAVFGSMGGTLDTSTGKVSVSDANLIPVPEDMRRWIINDALQHGQPTPDDYAIARTYHLIRSSQGGR